MNLIIGPEAISAYRRLAYTPWHALAEFVDNSTQSYSDNRDVLDQQFQAAGPDDENALTVAIVYDRNDKRGGFLRIADNAMGMSKAELENALHVARPPANTDGRSKYGMGMKTAAAWVGNEWVIRTTKLGEDLEHTVKVNVDRVAASAADGVTYSCKKNAADSHHTIIEITALNRSFHGRTLGKIADFLRSMYRIDIQNGSLHLIWRDQILSWEHVDARLLRSHDGQLYKKTFSFEVGGTPVTGWVGILDKGSRADAGFAILQADRVVKGWPDAWRPASLYGQLQGSNDLVNQRLLGEIHLDGFEVSHTKDNILWRGDEEDQVETRLKEECQDYRDFAKTRRKRSEDERGPSEVDVNAALEELEKELNSPEMVDQISISSLPPTEAIESSNRHVVSSVESTRNATLVGTILSNPAITWRIYLAPMSVNDAYVYSDSTKGDHIAIIVNQSHPFWTGELTDAESIRNYLRQCMYDSVAEWQARQKIASIDPETIKLLKDRLMRLPLEMESHSDPESETVATSAE